MYLDSSQLTRVGERYRSELLHGDGANDHLTTPLGVKPSAIERKLSFCVLWEILKYHNNWCTSFSTDNQNGHQILQQLAETPAVSRGIRLHSNLSHYVHFPSVHNLLACLDSVVDGWGHVCIGPSLQDNSWGTRGKEERGKSSLEEKTNTPANFHYKINVETRLNFHDFISWPLKKLSQCLFIFYVCSLVIMVLQ